MRKIVFKNPDGSISIVHPGISRDDPKGFTEEQALERALKAVPSYATEVGVVEKSTIPADRTFRAAWKSDLSVDMGKAKEIHRNRIRAMRKEKFPSLDAEWMKALAKGDMLVAAAVEAKRQELRDAPAFAAIEAASTPEELKDALPPSLV